MVILGISAYHGDSAAAILLDGRIVAAVEEERFTRVKHWAGLPLQSIRYCLDNAGFSLDQVDYIAVNRNPQANLMRKIAFVAGRRTPWSFLKDRLKNRRKILTIEDRLGESFHCDPKLLTRKMKRVEHHLAHAASAYCMSGFDKAAILTVDGFGDWSSTLSALGEREKIKPLKRVFFPHSLGVFYTAITQYIGFPNYGDEYKVMGLAPYGLPTYMESMRALVTGNPDGTFSLNTDYFTHARGVMEMRWEDGNPTIGDLFSQRMEELFGPKRHAGEPLEQRHKDIAASAQQRYEEIFANQLQALARMTGESLLCIAGGCGMNSVANGKIFELSPFREVYIPPQPGDGGGAVGAAAYVYMNLTGASCAVDSGQAYLGPDFDDDQILSLIEISVPEGKGIKIERIVDGELLCTRVAGEISQGKVVGWFQGRMEWGPRALGNRSILADPRRPDMKDILNLKIKRRESFRPFAPSVLREYVDEYFEMNHNVPFMSMVFQIRPEKRTELPAVTHVNGSGRLQSVRREDNPLYWKLIKRFQEKTGTPMVLNTSFNENEPIVCSPNEALDCFLRTNMDMLVMGTYILRRES